MLKTIMATETNHAVLEDQIRGLIYGNAIGDAIGLLTEFLTKKEAKQHYGDIKELEYDMKIDDFHRDRWKTGDWTDDTDQMILIMLSILENAGELAAVHFAAKLKYWRRHGYPELGDFVGMGIGSTTIKVLGHAKFDTEPHVAAEEIWEKSGRVVAPNGAIMRTSILGAYQYEDIDKVKENTLQICKVTHADPRCQASTVAMTTAISFMLRRESKHMKKDGSLDIDLIIKDAHAMAMECVSEKNAVKELKSHMFPSKLSSLKLDASKGIGYTYKCLGSGFWALRHSDFRDALQKLIMEAGDADTNGAVAGALLGCKLGAKKLPQSWLDGLLHKEWLDKIIDRFLPLIIPTYERQFPDDVKAEEKV